VAAEPGTFERLALMLAGAFSPLAHRLQPAEAEYTLADLGAYIPADLLPPAARSAIGAAAAAAEDLPGLAAALSDTIAAERGAIAVATDAARLAQALGRLISAARTIRDQLKTMGGGSWVTTAELADFADALPGRLLEMALVDYLGEEQPVLSQLLELLGVIELTRPNLDSRDPARPDTVVPRLRFERIGGLVKSPEQLGRDVYGWGDPGFDAAGWLHRLGGLLEEIGVPVARGVTPDPTPRPFIEFLVARLLETPPEAAPKGLDLVLSTAIGDGLTYDLPISDGLALNLTAKGSAGSGARARLQPPATLTVIPPTAATTVQGEVVAGLALTPEPGSERLTLLGVTGGTRLEARRISVGGKATFVWDAAPGEARGELGLDGRIEGGKLIISLAEADGFIGKLVGGFHLEAEFDLGFGWTPGGGVRFTGSGGLEIEAPTHVTVGPVEIPAVGLRLGVDGSRFPIDLTVTLKAPLGPMTATVEQIGATAVVSFPPAHDGNLGIADITLRFKPPTGVGLTIDAGVVRGGGYLRIDPQRGEYAGAVELMLAEVIAVRAFGVITTKNPDGSPGFSLLVVMSVEFGGGLQIGLGFTLLGVGGLVGLNRTMNLEALMAGVRTGALNSVLFPQDLVANAPRILSDLRSLFPAKPGTTLIGPMLKLGWGTPTLVSLTVGVIIEIPGNIALVGALKVAIPHEDAPLIVLKVSFAGAIEFDKQRLFFFASLYESRILFLPLSGDMGLLVAWGDDPNFVASVGGFHPRFLPPPLPFPTPTRVSITLTDTPTSRIRVQAYLAVTSNTAQFGARADLFFGFSDFNVQADIGFDALFQFSPLYFIAEVSASASLHAFGVGAFSLRLNLTLEGPTPWRARGTGSISLLFFDISADFDITWGDPKPPALEPIDVLPLLEAELKKDQNWTARPPAGANLGVTLRDLSGEAALVLHPVGVLEVRQRLAPLDLAIARLGARKARGANRFALAAAPGGTLARDGDLDELFPMAQFLELDDAAKVSRAAYERQHGGVALKVDGPATRSARAAKRIARFERVVIDTPFRRRPSRFEVMPGLLFDHLLAGASVAGSPLSDKRRRDLDPRRDPVAVTGERFVVASTATNKAAGPDAVFASQAAALQHRAALVTADPNLADELHVIPGVEMEAA
jgi:uncharacterized protein DUF6603